MRRHEFAAKARESRTPEVLSRSESILREKLEARRFYWTEEGGEDDRSGVDVWAFLANSKKLGVEVKVNRYGEVRIEYVSRFDERVPGWTVDDRKRSDYVLNLWPNRYWLVDFPSLRAVAKLHRDRYARLFAEHQTSSTSTGGEWETHFIPVPVGILLADIYGQTVVGTPLTAERTCPACHLEHPVGTTCASGWAPWPTSGPERPVIVVAEEDEDIVFTVAS